MQVSVTSADIAAVGAAVRSLGDGRDVVNEMAKEIRAAVPPVTKAVRAHTLATLPKKGGLNVWVAKAKVRASVKRGPQSAGVSLVAGRDAMKTRFMFASRADLKRLDSAGRVRHPGWGNRRHWYLQSVAPGFFSVPVHAAGDDFAGAVAKAVNTAARKVGL